MVNENIYMHLRYYFIFCYVTTFRNVNIYSSVHNFKINFQEFEKL